MTIEEEIRDALERHYHGWVDEDADWKDRHESASTDIAALCHAKLRELGVTMAKDINYISSEKQKKLSIDELMDIAGAAVERLTK